MVGMRNRPLEGYEIQISSVTRIGVRARLRLRVRRKVRARLRFRVRRRVRGNVNGRVRRRVVMSHRVYT